MPSSDTYIEKYLEFLGLQKESPSLDFLTKLTKVHLHKIPFDGSNFFLHQPEKISLKNKDILNGFLQGRGSVCYQSHGSLHKLLHLLGFKSSLVTATMFRFGRNPLKPYAEMKQDVHSVILITINEKEYLVDLAWGNAFRGPLPIGEEQVHVKGEDSRICIKDGDLYQLKAKIGEQWELEYQFQNIARRTKYFKGDVEFLCGPKHHLSQMLLLMRPLPSGGFKYVAQSIDKKGSLFFCCKLPDQTETTETQITDSHQAKEKLKKYGVDDFNCEQILSKFEFKL